MESNNSPRSRQQDWVPKGGRGRKSKPPLISHRSEIKMNSKKRQDVIHMLQDMFIDVLDLEVIQSVAQNCEFNLHASIEALMMLSEDVAIQKSPILGNASQSWNNMASAKARARKINVPELPLQANPRKVATPKNATYVTSNSLGHKSQVMAGRNRPASSALGAIKVSYKSRNNCEESDSDADVVVEEEKEYDMVGGSASMNSVHGAFSMMQAPYSIQQMMPQYMTPVVPLTEGEVWGKPPPKTKKPAQVPSMAAAVTKLPNIKTSANPPPKKLSSAQMAQQKQVKPLTIPERVQKMIREGTRVMVLMRGVPGSGKSHLAMQIVRLTMGKNCDPSKYIFSTDDYFILKKRFIPNMLAEAHNWNKERVRGVAERKLSPIFVDNTNTEVWEMKSYAEISVRNGYVLELLEPSTPWRYHEAQLARKNVHGVPRQQIQNMLARFEKNLTGRLLLTKLGLKYTAANKPPQPAANAPPPQVNQKMKTRTKPQPDAVSPIVIKPKKKRKKKPKAASLAVELQQPAEPAQAASFKDTLALFLAKKALEEGHALDPDLANSRLKSGVTISDILLPKKQDIPQQSSSCGPIKTWTTHDSVSSEGSVANMFGLFGGSSSQVEDDSSSGDDSSDDDSDEEEEEDDDTDPQMQEWLGSDNDWQYQSDTDVEADEEELIGTDNAESVPSEMQCWEYILVTDDSKWVYQKEHPETRDAGAQEESSATEQTEGLLIDLSAGSDDTVELAASKVDFSLNAEPSIETKMSNDNFLTDILSKAEDKMELLSPVDAPIAAVTSTEKTESGASIPSHRFSLDEIDQWLCDLPVEVETGTEAIHWLAPSFEEDSMTPAAVEQQAQSPVEIKIAAAQAVGVSIKTIELCPLGLEISPDAVTLNEEKLTPETNLSIGGRQETDTSDLPAIKSNTDERDSSSSRLENTEPEVVPSTDSRQHISEPHPQTADGASNEDEYHSAVSSEEASSNGKKEATSEEQKTHLTLRKAAPTYDLLTWVMKCKEEEAEDKGEEWEQVGALVNNKEVEIKPDDGPREQRSLRKIVERKLKEPSNAEVVQEAEVVPPELQAWGTVQEPAKSWENRRAEQDELKPSDDPQPQRPIFASEEPDQSEESGSGTCLASRRTPTLLTPHDFMHSSWENRLTTELQKIASSDAHDQDAAELSSDMADGARVNADRDVADASTNTHYMDFTLVSQVDRPGDSTEPEEGIRIVTTRNRIINEGVGPLLPFNRPVPVTLMLDKSSMTIEEDDINTAMLVSAQEVNAQKNHDFKQLVAMFPDVPQDDLKEIFEKCCGDLHWTIDLLLDSKLEQYTPLTPVLDIEPVGEVATHSETVDYIFQGLPLIGMSNPEPSAPPLEEEDVALCSSEVNKTWRGGNGTKAPLSEELQKLKRHLEESITLNDDSYSEQTLRIRKLRHGELLDMGEVTTKPQHFLPNGGHIMGESSLGAIGFSGTRTPTPQSGDVGGLNRNGVTVDEEADGSSGSGSSSGADEEEALQVALDPGFVSQLHQIFGNPALPCPEDVDSVVNLPLSLARQIHYYLVESQLALLEQQHKQMEQMIQEDEELARRWQEEELEGSTSVQEDSTAVPDLQEIMDMEMALALYKTDQAQWRGKETKDDLATKLSKQMLCEMFPKLDKDVLLEVFTAHEKSFEKTVEEVVASMGGVEEEGVRTVMAPEALAAAHGRSLMEQAKQEQSKADEADGAAAPKSLPILVVRDPVDSNNTISPKEQAMDDANHYRAEASRHYQLRNECFRKAQDAYSKGMTAVASYYSQVAGLHRQRIDDSNAKAAASLLAAHTLARDDNTTLDLHYLHVAESIQALDLFLDHHIVTVAEQRTKTSLFLITGRGMRSSDGRSRIRPAVERRLRQRGIKWSVVNPGLLKVVVMWHFPLSCAIGTNS